MTTYRFTFLHNLDVDYWSNKQGESHVSFHEIHKKYYKHVREIKNIASGIGIYDIFHFYEPNIEITFREEHEWKALMLYAQVNQYLYSEGIKDITPLRNGDEYLDWFCRSDKEREFGGKRHMLCSELADLFYEYNDSIKEGKGIHEQVKRTIHTICNPLGINYWDEAKICFSRGLICILFRFFSFKNAVWIYTKVFRQKY